VEGRRGEADVKMEEKAVNIRIRKLIKGGRDKMA
jgi:hypothetical protein